MAKSLTRGRRHLFWIANKASIVPIRLTPRTPKTWIGTRIVAPIRQRPTEGWRALSWFDLTPDLLGASVPDVSFPADWEIRNPEAGLTVDAGFNRVARELGKGYPELGDEFALCSIELGFLTDRRQAFENLANRIDLDSIRGVVTTMVQTEKYGTPLASALRVLAAEFRNERMMRAEEKAARLPAIMTVPLILFILPTLFVVILGPAACSIHDNFINK